MSHIIQQALVLVNQRRATQSLPAMRTDHRLARAARYWSALCEGRSSWRESFADLEPWNAMESAPLDTATAWVLVSTTPASVEQSVAQWFERGHDRAALAALTELSRIGMALHQTPHQWHWVIYSADPIVKKRVWW